MPSNLLQVSLGRAAALVVLLHLGACATAPTSWGLPEITGGTAEQRLQLRERVAKALGFTSYTNTDAMKGICEEVRREVGTKARCSMVIEKFSGYHYLVELPQQTPAMRRDPAEFKQSSGMSDEDLRLASGFEGKFGPALLAGEVVDVPLKNGRPDVAQLDESGVEDVTQLARRLRGELPGLLREATDARVRQAAALLLGWTGRPDVSLAALEPGMADPDENVRNVASLSAAMLAPAGDVAVQRRWAALWCREMVGGSYIDRTKALLGLARLKRAGAPSPGHDCLGHVRSYAEETAMPGLKSLGQIIAGG